MERRGPECKARRCGSETTPKSGPLYAGNGYSNSSETPPRRPPDFLFSALDMTACAAFIKESRMKFANANELHRKSGSD
jgi:hypothetical protein